MSAEHESPKPAAWHPVGNGPRAKAHAFWFDDSRPKKALCGTVWIAHAYPPLASSGWRRCLRCELASRPAARERRS